MTKWQESCITALASSPMAWETFKMKQRNSKLLWQYINRIWPYHKITKPDTRAHRLKMCRLCADKNDILYNWLNIGIEIEHDAVNTTPDRIGQTALLQNCVDYGFGYDGNSSNRLRENRLRLNGIKGLKGLHTLLSYMKYNCSIAKNSSLHIHVDCKYDKSYDRIASRILTHVARPFENMTNDYRDNVLKSLNIIFDTDGDVEYFIKQIRGNSSFKTLEYRFGIPNFNYSDYVLEILTVIHWTECVKHKACLNKQYLKMLAIIARKLRKDSLKIPDNKLPSRIQELRTTLAELNTIAEHTIVRSTIGPNCVCTTYEI